MRLAHLFLLLIVTMVVHAEGGVVIMGNSTLRGRKLEACTIGSITEKALVPPGTPDVIAVLVPWNAPVFEAPCRVQSAPGLEAGTEMILWSVGVPASRSLKALRILRGAQLLAEVEAPLDKKLPTLDLAESWTGKDLSLGYVLTRQDRFMATSVWVRWSKDGGATWSDHSRLLPGDVDQGTLDLEASVEGELAKLTLEFWIPCGLDVTKIRYQVGQGGKP